jgi:putative ABC transport system permease protein
MKMIDIFRIAFSTFVHNKMRTFLTIFGVAIGVGAIVFLLSIGYGLQEITVQEISSIKALTSFNVTSGNSSIISMNDEAVKQFKNLEGVASVNPGLSVSGQIAFEKSQTDALINIVSAEYADLDAPRIESGELYKSDNDDKIAVTTVVANAFNIKPADLIGKKVKIVAYIADPANPKNINKVEKEYEISAIIKDAAAAYVYAPIGTIKIPAGTNYSLIKVKATDSKQMLQIKSKLTEMGYKASSLGEKIDQMNQIFNIAKLALFILGAIALVVASIGMFNTLTISLLERTKDIGIMKSLGATDREVYSIFLSESTMISFFGGAAGIAIALILGNVLNLFIAILAARAGGEPVNIFHAPEFFLLIVLGFSIFVGVLTGFYPAKRAAKLNPLDALRYE